MKIKENLSPPRFKTKSIFFSTARKFIGDVEKKSTNRAVPLRAKRDQLNFERARVRPAAAAVVVLSVKARARHRSSSRTALVAGVIEIDLCQG